MRLTNTAETYGLVHQSLHWAVAALILTMIPLGVYMHELPVGTPQQVADKVWLYSLHKTIGVSALAVALGRIGWALSQPHPRALQHGLETFGARTIHALLYVCIVAMPLFGWLHHAASTGYAPIWWPDALAFIGQDLPLVPKSEAVSAFFGWSHKVTGFVLVGSLALHIAGAVKHSVVDRDATLSRMVPGAYDETGIAPPRQAGTGRAIVAAGAVVLAAATVIAAGFLMQRPADLASDAAVTTVSDQAWVIDREASFLGLEVQQLGSPVGGRFERWTADVVFDPDAPADAAISATVETGSLELGDVSDRARSDEFLDAPAFPTATFVSDTVTETDTGYDAVGTLTIGGRSVPFTLPFTFSRSDDRAIVTAQATIPRLDFGIGAAFPDSSSVGTDVLLDIAIEATRPPPGS